MSSVSVPPKLQQAIGRRPLGGSGGPDRAGAAPSSLKLDSSKNNLHQSEITQEKCPSIVGCHWGVMKQGRKLVGIKSYVPCKKWSCPVCGPKRAKQVRRRIFKGSLVQEAMRPGFRNSYNVKLLTLTCPGKHYRQRVTPGQADVEMKQAYTKLNKALKKEYGSHGYFWVEEPQGDGYPHLHVVIVGESISGIDVKSYIENLWRNKYKMGFVRLNVVNSVEHAIRYLTKYLTKGLSPIRPYSRVFSCSRGALLPIEKPEWLRSEFRLGLKPLDGEEVNLRSEFDLNHGVPPNIWNAMDENLKREFWAERLQWVRSFLIS